MRIPRNLGPDSVRYMNVYRGAGGKIIQGRLLSSKGSSDMIARSVSRRKRQPMTRIYRVVVYRK